MVRLSTPLYGNPLDKHIDYITREVTFTCPQRTCGHVGTLKMVIDTGSNTTIVDAEALAQLCAACGVGHYDEEDEHDGVVGLKRRVAPRGKKNQPARGGVNLSPFPTIRERAVAFPRKVLTIPELEMSGGVIVSKGVGHPLPPFRAGSMNIRDAIPLFPKHLDGILGTNAMSKLVVIVRPGERRVDVVTQFTPTPQHVQLDVELTDPDNKPGGELGNLLFAKTDSGNLLLDTGNQATTFCTHHSGMCDPSTKGLVLNSVDPAKDVNLDQHEMRIRARPESLNTLHQEDPSLVPAGNIGISLMLNTDYFQEFVIDISKNSAFVAPAENIALGKRGFASSMSRERRRARLG